MWYWSFVPPKSFDAAFASIAGVSGVTGVMLVSSWGLPTIVRGELTRKNCTAIAGYATSLIASSKLAMAKPYGKLKTVSAVFDGIQISITILSSGLLIFCWESGVTGAVARSQKWANSMSRLEK